MERKEVTVSELEGGYVITKRIRTFDDAENLIGENINQAVAIKTHKAMEIIGNFLDGFGNNEG